MNKISPRDLAVMAICLVLGLFSKRIISPLTNTLTDFFRIPGGSAAVGLSMAFLIVGKQMTGAACAGTLMGFVQSLLAIALGMSGYQGIMAVFSYMLPGVIIDLLAWKMRRQDLFFCFSASILSCMTSAVVSSLLVFHLRGASLMLWLLLAGVSGMIGGYCAHMVSGRLRVLLKTGGMHS